MAKKAAKPKSVAAAACTPTLLREFTPALKHDVNSVAFFPSGQLLASGSQDGDVRIWITETGTSAKTNPQKIDRWAVMEVACSDDGSTVAIVRTSQKGKRALGWDGLDIGLKQGTDRGHLWNYATSMNRRIDPHSKTHGVLKSLSFVGFDKLVAVTLGAIRMFNLASGEPTGESMPHKKCNIAAVSRDGKTIVSGDDDGQIFVWTALTGSKRRRIKSHTAAVSRLEFSEDGKQFASAGADQTMRIWDVGTGKMRRTWSGSWKSTLALKFLPGDNGLMAVNDYDGEGKVQLGVFAAERSLSEYPIAEDVRCADIARDGTSIATGHFSGKIRLWGFTS